MGSRSLLSPTSRGQRLVRPRIEYPLCGAADSMAAIDEWSRLITGVFLCLQVAAFILLQIRARLRDRRRLGALARDARGERWP
jgi:hypothetical protein